MRERVMAMAGSLSIQHGHDGKGLALVVRLPCVNSLQPRSGRAGMKILLVDDHVIVRSGLRNLLTSAVGRADFGGGATAAMRCCACAQDRPDLVLLDLNLPGIGGLELLRRMLLEDRRRGSWC